MPARPLVLVTLLVSSHAVAAEPSRPNVVMIVGDDQAWTDFGFMGHPVVETPHLDRLAAESATFVNGYVPTSLCRPSLVTLLTGLYPHQHKVTGNDPPKGTDRKEMLRHIRSASKLPALLADSGYVSFQTGKWWEGEFKEGGFTHGMTHGDPAKRGRHGDQGLAIGRQGLGPIWNFLDQVPGLDETQRRPFFVWYAPFLPHTPHNPPERLLAKYTAPDRPIALAKYYAMCEWLDETCGELLAGLDERGLRDDTLVVYVTDNGWIQRTPASDLPSGWDQPFAPKSKRSPYDGGVRTPILLHWPGRIAPGRFETPISSVDLAPTLLTVCGVDLPPEMPGQNLLDVIATEGTSARAAVFGEIFEHDVVDLDDPSAGLLFRWCRQGNWKLIVPTGKGTPELYNLKADPHETKNLASSNPEQVTALQEAIDAWWTPRRE